MSESILSAMMMDVQRFQVEVLDFPIPNTPQFLEGSVFEAKLHHLSEELTEFETAVGMYNQADALIDLVYVAMGALIQMGVCPKAIFDEVQRANMAKHLGSVAHRPKTAGKDAEKPQDWTPPDIAKMLSVTKADIDWMAKNRIREIDYAEHDDDDDNWAILNISVEESIHPELFTRAPKGSGAPSGAPSGGTVDLSMFRSIGERMTGGSRNQPMPLPGPKILVMGHARHGKDTVSELLRDQYGLSFTSSSLFCAQHVIMEGIHEARSPELDAMHGLYTNAEECFNDRANHRTAWYNAIRDFNRPDLTTLGRAIFAEHDVYCGIRHHSEFNALRNAAEFDFSIWVDRQEWQPTESRSSCSVEPWMADFVLDNNGELSDLENNLESLMETILGAWKYV